VLVTLIEAHESNHYDFGAADPVEAIEFRMERDGLTPRDLEPYIGQSGRVSEVLNRRLDLNGLAAWPALRVASETPHQAPWRRWIRDPGPASPALRRQIDAISVRASCGTEGAQLNRHRQGREIQVGIPGIRSRAARIRAGSRSPHTTCQDFPLSPICTAGYRRSVGR
jgi:hypothetical protein